MRIGDKGGHNGSRSVARLSVRRTRVGWRWLLAASVASLPALLLAGAITGSLPRDALASSTVSGDPPDPCPTILATPCPAVTALPSIPVLPTITILSTPTPTDPPTATPSDLTTATPLPTDPPIATPTLPVILPTPPPTIQPTLDPTPGPTPDPGPSATPSPSPGSGGGGSTGGSSGGGSSGGGSSGGGGSIGSLAHGSGGGSSNGSGVSVDSAVQGTSDVFGLAPSGGTTPPMPAVNGLVPSSPSGNSALGAAGAFPTGFGTGFPSALDGPGLFLAAGLVIGLFAVLGSMAVYVSRLR